VWTNLIELKDEDAADRHHHSARTCRARSLALLRVLSASAASIECHLPISASPDLQGHHGRKQDALLVLSHPYRLQISPMLVYHCSICLPLLLLLQFLSLAAAGGAAAAATTAVSMAAN